MTLPRGSLALHAWKSAQANEAGRDATKAAAEGLRGTAVAKRETAAAVFDAAATRRRQDPEAAAVMQAAGDALMAGADALTAAAAALERIGEAQCLTTGLLAMLAAERE